MVRLEMDRYGRNSRWVQINLPQPTHYNSRQSQSDDLTINTSYGNETQYTMYGGRVE